jgi:hypothetical protein
MEADDLCHRLRQLEVEIDQILCCLPPHSIKPPVVIDLMALEDERDMLLKKIGEFR